MSEKVRERAKTASRNEERALDGEMSQLESRVAEALDAAADGRDTPNARLRAAGAEQDLTELWRQSDIDAVRRTY